MIYLYIQWYIHVVYCKQRLRIQSQGDNRVLFYGRPDKRCYSVVSEMIHIMAQKLLLLEKGLRIFWFNQVQQVSPCSHIVRRRKGCRVTPEVAPSRKHIHSERKLRRLSNLNRRKPLFNSAFSSSHPFQDIRHLSNNVNVAMTTSNINTHKKNKFIAPIRHRSHSIYLYQASFLSHTLSFSSYFIIKLSCSSPSTFASRSYWRWYS